MTTIVTASTTTTSATTTKRPWTTCFSCFEFDGTCDQAVMCMPGESECVSVQLTDANGTTVYWRGCNVEGFQSIPDGCTCDESGFSFYCKKTCAGENCNNDEHMSTIDQVSA